MAVDEYISTETVLEVTVTEHPRRVERYCAGVILVPRRVREPQFTANKTLRRVRTR